MSKLAYKNLRIGIIGTNGRTGSILIAKLIKNEFKNITGFSRSISFADTKLNNGVTYESIDFDKNGVDDLVEKFNGFEAIVFLASACQSDVHQLFVVDIDGLFKCIEACRILKQRKEDEICIKPKNEGYSNIHYHNPPHIIFISVLDVEERKNWWSLEGSIKNYIIAKRCCEHELRNSNLNWTILKTGWLTLNHDTIGKIKNAEEINFFYRENKLNNELTLERDDLADVILCCFKYLNQLNHKYIPILRGDHLIEDVIKSV